MASSCTDISGCGCAPAACRKAVVEVVGQLDPLDVGGVSPEVDSISRLQPLEVALDALQVVRCECRGSSASRNMPTRGGCVPEAKSGASMENAAPVSTDSSSMTRAMLLPL